MSTHSATARLGVDVCLTQIEGMEVPECPHGPMLLFERFFKDGRSPRKFYACSACRDRKDCAFFQWEDEKITEARRKAHNEIIESSKPSGKQTRICEELNSLFSSSKEDDNCSWLFCYSCNLLVMDETELHKGHDVQRGEKVENLRHPSLILRPQENVKAHAQFLFSSKSTQFLVSVIQKLGFKKVLCLGTPRIHEKIQLDRNKGSKKKGLDSLLLDIDYRYGQFNHPSRFCYYNMFNHHFFNEENQRTFHSFLTCKDDEKIILVMDPPFGGLVEILAATVKKIWTVWRKQNETKDDTCSRELPTLWIFPYFMESHIQTSLPSLKMMDYKVDYDNHPHFKGKQDKGSKRGSPVRIFTNIKPSDIRLPADEGYKFCKICERFVAPENKHCSDCDSCTSKDGRQYVHCNQCGTCIKPGRSHCTTCNHCELPSHDCMRLSSAVGCHICGNVDHKRKDCPNRPQKDPKPDKNNDKHKKGKKRRLKVANTPENKKKKKKTTMMT